jgi:hypothetical protein
MVFRVEASILDWCAGSCVGSGVLWLWVSPQLQELWYGSGGHEWSPGSGAFWSHTNAHLGPGTAQAELVLQEFAASISRSPWVQGEACVQQTKIRSFSAPDIVSEIKVSDFPKVPQIPEVCRHILRSGSLFCRSPGRRFTGEFCLLISTWMFAELFPRNGQAQTPALV